MYCSCCTGCIYMLFFGLLCFSFELRRVMFSLWSGKRVTGLRPHIGAFPAQTTIITIITTVLLLSTTVVPQVNEFPLAMTDRSPNMS